MKKPSLHSHTITHDLFIFEGVRECFAFAKPHEPTLKPKPAKECIIRYQSDLLRKMI